MRFNNLTLFFLLCDPIQWMRTLVFWIWPFVVEQLIIRVWWICKSLLRWSPETWPQVRQHNDRETHPVRIVRPFLICNTCVLLQPCAFTLHCSWGLPGWSNHATIYYLPAMLPTRLFSSISSPAGLELRGKFYIFLCTVYDAIASTSVAFTLFSFFSSWLWKKPTKLA